MRAALRIVGLAFVLSGCATAPIYEWGGYDDLMYQQYKEPATTPDVRTGLEAHVLALETNRQRVPPGLYAEVGTLYLQAGNTDQALQMYRRERAYWPESKTLMDAMIGNIERRNGKDAK
jgi:hypothetical protein